MAQPFRIESCVIWPWLNYSPGGRHAESRTSGELMPECLAEQFGLQKIQAKVLCTANGLRNSDEVPDPLGAYRVMKEVLIFTISARDLDFERGGMSR